MEPRTDVVPLPPAEWHQKSVVEDMTHISLHALFYLLSLIEMSTRGEEKGEEWADYVGALFKSEVDKNKRVPRMSGRF